MSRRASVAYTDNMSEAHINLAAVRRNAKKITKTAPLIAVVKADAYGHGAVAVCGALSDTASAFAVATVAEAAELIAAGIKLPVLVLGKSHCVLPAPNVVYSASSFAEIDRLCRLSAPGLAVKVNTGMNRYGCAPSDAAKLAAYARERGVLHSVYSHLRAPEDRGLSEKQLAVFSAATKGIRAPRHLIASGGIALGRDYLFDYARCGIALYGGIEGFEQAMTVTAPIAELRDVPPGEGCGYGSAVFGDGARVAVIEIGYADGFRRLTGSRFVAIGDIECPVVAVCMDVSFAVVPPCVTADDTVEITGRNMPIGRLARSYGTIPYEVMTSFGARVTRKYG